jgi:hypothetical protein
MTMQLTAEEGRAALVQLVRATAEAKGLDAAVLCAMVEQESGWNAWAFNPEPHYKYVVDWKTGQPFRKLTPEENSSERPPADFPYPKGADRDAEFWGQQMSFGLLQLMGGAARERGFRGVFLTELCDPVTGLEWGCAHWMYKLRVAQKQGPLDPPEKQAQRALQLWNGGGNPVYWREVLARAPKYKT